MNEQLGMFDPVTPAVASQLRHEAMVVADRHANAEWRTWARAAIRHCATTLADFTADDVHQRLHEVGAPATHTTAALGPQFSALAKAGEITKTGALRQSRLPQRHRDLVVWTATDTLRAATRANIRAGQ